MGIRLGVCEDDQFMRSMLTAALQQLGFEVTISVSSASQALELLDESPGVQVFVIDMHLGPGPNGLDLARAIRRVKPEVGFVFVSSFENPRLLEPDFLGLPTGSQYVVKSSMNSLDTLVEAIGAACDRKSDDLIDSGLLARVTRKQTSVLALLSQGLSNSEIAKSLGITEDTVEGIIRRTAKRLGIEREQSTNQRVLMTRAYLKATGGLR